MKTLHIILPLIGLFLAMQSHADAQVLYRGRVTDEGGRAIQDVSIVLYQSATSAIGFGFSDEKGEFEVECNGNPASIGFILLGYETRQIPIREFKNGQTVMLRSKAFQLKEVNVRPDKITQRSDTLVYNVLSFRQSQDRSIADVLKKMPGIEVNTDGRISFEGRPINKFYIEGMDLMGSKYAQASENLSADMVSNVQVLQNHQPIRTLKGVQFSDQAALNIQLKENVKNAWAGTMDLGQGSTAQGGANYLYSGRLMGMLFGRKRQNLSMYKCDNTGKDISKEVTDLAATLRDNQEENGLLKALVVPAADIDGERTTFNDSHLVATNHLMKTAHDNDVRVQLNYLWDKRQGYTSQQTEYIDLDGVVLSEENRVESEKSRLKGDFTYKVNKDRIYVNNRLYGSIEFDKSLGNTLLNGNQTAQHVKVRRQYLTEDFQMISRLKNGNSIECFSQSTYSYLPGKLLTVGGFTEKLDVSAFETYNYAAFSHKVAGFTISHRAGYQLKLQQMDVDYLTTENYAQHDLYVASSLHLERKSLKMRATLKANVTHSSYEEIRRTKFTLQPNLNLQYDCSASTSATVSYNYQERPNSLMTIYRTPVFTSYRTQASHTGSLETRRLHSASLLMRYKQPIRGMFLNLMFTWTRRTNEVLYESTYDAPLYMRPPTEHRYNGDTYLVNANAARSFYWAKTLLSLSYRQLWSNYCLLQAGEKTPWQMRNAEVTFKLTMQPAKTFSCELRCQVQTNKQERRNAPTAQGARFTKFNHSASLNLFPSKQFEAGIKGELYHSTDKSVSSNFFADARLSYQFKRYELRLTVHNLFGNHQYEHRLQTSATDTYSSYRLRPREILCTFSVEL